MLKRRFITALVLILFFLSVIWLLPPTPFMYVTGLLMLFIAWEWTGLTYKAAHTKNKSYIRYVYLAAAAASLVLIRSLPWILVLVTSVVAWIGVFITVLRYAFSDQSRVEKLYGLKNVFIKEVIGLLFISSAWLAIMHLKLYFSAWYLTLLFVIVAAADTGAYFVGRFWPDHWWSRHKLIERVSPNKTWEGLVGGIVLALVITAFIAWSVGLTWRQHLGLYFLTVLTVVFAIMGDLFESLLKRLAGVKDSGNILPGHGGLLDRFDSVLAALPIFTLAILWYFTRVY